MISETRRQSLRQAWNAAESVRPWKTGHKATQIANASGQVVGEMRHASDAALAIAAVNVLPLATGEIRIDVTSSPELQRAAIRFAIDLLRRFKPSCADAVAALERWAAP